LVRFQPATIAAAQQNAHAAAGALVILADFDDTVDGLQLVQVVPGQEQAAVASYQNDASVQYAEPDWALDLDTDPPNDPDFNFPLQKLWGLQNIGQQLQSGTAVACPCPQPPNGCLPAGACIQTPNGCLPAERGDQCSGCDDDGTPGADIRARPAWDIWQGGADFRIAVLDTGVDYNHCDLQENIWTNLAELNGMPAHDDDANGYNDDVHGYDFLDNDSDPIEGLLPDEQAVGHGTSVAGIIAARGNNGIGLVGVNWRAKIVALRIGAVPGGGDVLNCNSAFVSALFKAIRYCIKNDIRVMNLSWSMNKYCPTLYDVIKEARDNLDQAGVPAGIILVASAGNNNRNTDLSGNFQYPAGYGWTHDDTFMDQPVHVVGLDNVIAVAATDNNDNLASFSNYGAKSVHLGAPGVHVWSTHVIAPEPPNTEPIRTYRYFGGTSAAAPMVAGVAALVWSKYPTLDYTDVRTRILNTVRRPATAALLEKTVTGGVVNAYVALTHDCNENGIEDTLDIANGTTADCTAFKSNCCVEHATPSCDVPLIAQTVCAGRCFPPTCAVDRDLFYCCQTGWDRDCAAYAAERYPATCRTQGDGIPDACQPSSDCNANGIPDACDISGGGSCPSGSGLSCDVDCNGIPDDCGACCTEPTPLDFGCRHLSTGACSAIGGIPHPGLTCASADLSATGCSCRKSACCDNTTFTCSQTTGCDCRAPSKYFFGPPNAPSFNQCSDCSFGACCVGGACVQDGTQATCQGIPNSRFVGAGTCDTGFGLQPGVCVTLTPLCGGDCLVEAVVPDPSLKTRTISFSNPNVGSTAILVRLIDLEKPNPPNNNPAGPCCPPGNFTTFDTNANSVCTGTPCAVFPPDTPSGCSESAGYRCTSDADCPNGSCAPAVGCAAVGEGNGCARWVAPPFGYLESNDNPGIGNYRAARLQCEPSCYAWHTEAAVHVTGAEIVPSSTYEVVVVPCVDDVPDETAASCALTMTTRRAGDIATPFQGDPPLTQPNAVDVANAVHKFRNLAGSPPKVIAQIQPNAPEPNSDFNAIDIVTVVDNVRGFGYTYSGPCVCPSTVPCNAKACLGAGQCTGDYGAGATCVKTCDSGPRAGQPCNNDLNCGSCIGGPATGNGAAGIPCDANSDCASGKSGLDAGPRFQYN
jgi:subtilisin family serine protease